MTEKEIKLEQTGLSGLFGVNDVNMDYIRSFFPKVKIVARGNIIRLLGSKSELEYFEKKMSLLLEFYDKYNKLSTNDIKEIMNAETSNLGEIVFQDKEVLLYGKNGKPIKAKTPNQKRLVKEFDKSDLLFAIGPAGTGKTYIAIALAIKALKDKLVQRIILSRPAVEAGEKLGFLPGDFKEKLDPYLQALYDALDDILPPKKLGSLMNDRIVQIAPLAYMRGRTLSNSVVILDEAQNSTVNQLKMFLTRMGENSKFIVTGDVTQVDLEGDKKSGLIHARNKLQNVDGISIVEFGEKDVVRHPLVKKIITLYD
ncbi:MAG: PhoH family protein [Bacteroidales bacterium]|nr:PhoH family protein [Bacteroidales bacterium]